MRTDRCRYAEWQERETDELLAMELYDHREGPLKNANRSAIAPFALVPGNCPLTHTPNLWYT